jgi:uncharacterized cupin superfamily protein
MGKPIVTSSPTDIDLRPAPIEPTWILEGNPEARSRIVFKSHDGTASTMIWDCTPGVFNWYYDCDETIHIIEGEVNLTTDRGTFTVKAGEAVFFPGGSFATWHVTTYVRKLAFLRHTLPLPAGLMLRLWKRLHTGLARPQVAPPATAGALSVQNL